MLMDYAISRAREAGCHKLVLTSDKRRRRAHQFYRSLGFRPSAHGFRLYF
jgi:GNAT superfamily N-acetyltransferase